ncbi:Sushi domain-containing protein 5 Precursor [Channa argus]|uniref:Sushi domain-containing protein 5 n=1 Tax=Channa argus TaxID=215402 RepID=A0A6G1QYC9_CHAAH|nr:Sushi domain-containing protein 5 Precursor [Channa argus]KAK2921124.1 hypothetical protein Q8A73_000609 [Channa argus]
MLDRNNQSIQSLLLGCLSYLVVTTVANADGRVFVLDLRNSSGLQGFTDAEQACASQHARLASAEELRHSVVECFFSSCTRGWLYGATVGTTLCNIVGGALKAVDVRTENATEDEALLDAFCIKDKGVPCGDPPSFPNARLQTHSGFEMGDELLYTCVPGYVMPSGQSAFSLLCDSCGEWYGLVQICVKDDSEIHVDYEDKFTESFGEAEHQEESSKGAHSHMHKEVDVAAYSKEMSQEQHDTSFSVKKEEASQSQHGEQEMKGQVMKFEGAVDGKQTDAEQSVQDFIGHPTWEQERREVVGTDAAAATEASVSLLSQKHMFWFPSESFQEEGHPVSTNPVTQSTQRSSGGQSEESKEHVSEEWHPHPVDVADHDHDQESYDDQDNDDRDDRETDDGDDREDSHHDQDERDSHQDEDDHDDHRKLYIPAQREGLNRRDSHEKHDEDHDDHFDMGDREDDHTRYGNQEFDDRHNAFGKHESYGDHEDVTDHRGDNDDDREHPRGSEEHPDHDDHSDGEGLYDLDEDDNNHYTDPDGRDHDDHDSYDDSDSHEDDGHYRVIFSRATGQSQNITQKTAGGKTTTDETWLDGYPIIPEDTKNDNATAEKVSPGSRERGTNVRTTDRPNEVEIRRPVSFTSSPEQPEFPTTGPKLERGIVEVLWPGLVPTAAPSPDHSESLSYSDTLDYDTQQAAPTHSWLGDLTENPFLDHGPAPPVHEREILTGVMEEHTMHNLPGETGERGDMEVERGETTCTGDDCPPLPPSSSTQGPKVAAIIVAVCAVATAVIIGVWCYRRQQQKSSVYEMNGKGQSQSRQAQQIEMQQKV